MYRYMQIGFDGLAAFAPPVGAAGLPDWLASTDTGIPISDELVIAIFGFAILLLTGLLLHLRRIRITLAKETLALRKSEGHLRTIGDTLHDITIFQLEYDISKKTFRFSFLGSGYGHVLGVSRNRVMHDAQLVLDHILEEDLGALRNAFHAAIDRLEPANLEIRVLDAGGSYKWLRISAIPQRFGENLIWDGFMQDITDKKEAERSVAEESRNFQNLFETIDDLLVVCDMEGQLVHSNPSFNKRLGYSNRDLAKMSIFDIYPKEHQSEIYRMVAQLRSDPSVSCDLPLQMKDGALILAEMNLFQGFWKHQQAIFGVARDVARYQQTESALRESQKILQLIIDTIPMSIFWKDKDSVYLGCNRAFIQECRLDSLHDVVGKTPFDLFDSSIAHKIVDRDQGVITANEALTGYSESQARPDGSMEWREISLIPLRNELGNAIGVLGVWRDITEQNRAEERLKRTLDDMERFNQLMRGRERRTLELKDEINDLLLELGRHKKYRTTAEDMT